jgi:hypothetical protein
VLFAFELDYSELIAGKLLFQVPHKAAYQLYGRGIAALQREVLMLAFAGKDADANGQLITPSMNRSRSARVPPVADKSLAVPL